MLITAGCAAPASPPKAKSVKPPAPLTTSSVGPHYEPESVSFWNEQSGVTAGRIQCPGQCTGVVALTKDGGKHWKNIYRGGFRIYNVHTAGTSEIWGIVRHCGQTQICTQSIIHSNNQGRNWYTLHHVGTPMYLDFSDRLNGWVIDRNTNGLRYTTDGGTNWHHASNPCQGELFPMAVAAENKTSVRVLCTGQQDPTHPKMQAKAIYHSTNKGQDWTPITELTNLERSRGLSSQGFASGMQFLPDGSGWLWETGGTLLHTSDGGRHFTTVSTRKDHPAEKMVADFVDHQHGYILLRNNQTDRYELAATKDGGHHLNIVQSWPYPHKVHAP